MGDRFSDTVALSSTPFGGNENSREHHTKEIRKIDNGYITRENHDDGLGFTSMETYSANHPSAGDPGILCNDKSSMSRAVNFMNKK